MSSRFSEWFNKVIGENPPADNTKPQTIISEDSILPHEQPALFKNPNSKLPKKHDYDAYADYAALKRQAHIKKATQQITNYDDFKAKTNPVYKSFSKNCDDEVDDADVNDVVDNALDIEQQKKLGIYNGLEDTSEKRKQELKNQESKYNERLSARLSSLDSLKAKLSQYDAKQIHRDAYKSYLQQCEENDQDTDEEGDRDKHEEDAEMKRVLMEKLGVYNEAQETAEIKQRRLKKSQAIEEKIRKHKELNKS